jgi:DNA-binding transcriptional MerR regulator
VGQVRLVGPSDSSSKIIGPGSLTPYLGTAGTVQDMNAMTIGKLAAAEGVGVETVRFYQRRGLLATPERRGSTYREYSEADRARLVFIRRARDLGFTLGEIAELLRPAEAHSTDEIVVAAQAKLAAVDAQVRDLVQLRCRLRQLVRLCEHGDGQQCAALLLP